MRSAVTSTSLVLPFPFEWPRQAQLIIPRDMTKGEAERLCAFVMSLAAPELPHADDNRFT